MNNTVAAIQLTSSNCIDTNMATIDTLVTQAHAAGAQLALLPENCAFMGAHQGESKNIAEPLGTGAIQEQFASIASRHNMWLIVGAFPTIEHGKTYQTLLVYDNNGNRIAHYHKRHLFNVTLPNGGESYRESDAFHAGTKIQTVDTPIGCVGLSICYDLRFPEHFRALVNSGATLLVLPAAFTHKTGQAHWETLLRARAIENQCYMVAAGQTGTHPDMRQTWGHSMIINPWGEILSSLKEEQGITTGPIDISSLQQVRTLFPALEHQL